MLKLETETRPRQSLFLSRWDLRRDIDTSQDRLKAKTVRPRPQHCIYSLVSMLVNMHRSVVLNCNHATVSMQLQYHPTFLQLCYPSTWSGTSNGCRASLRQGWEGPLPRALRLCVAPRLRTTAWYGGFCHLHFIYCKISWFSLSPDTNITTTVVECEIKCCLCRLTWTDTLWFVYDQFTAT